MAKMKATPKNFEQAKAALAGRDSMRLGNNTFLESYTDGTQVDRICVRLHSTNIVAFYPDGRVTLHTGGYRTRTTKERINHFITGRVYSRNYAWFYIAPLPFGADNSERIAPRLFIEGMEDGGGTA